MALVSGTHSAGMANPHNRGIGRRLSGGYRRAPAGVEVAEVYTRTPSLSGRLRSVPPDRHPPDTTTSAYLRGLVPRSMCTEPREPPPVSLAGSVCHFGPTDRTCLPRFSLRRDSRARGAPRHGR